MTILISCLSKASVFTFLSEYGIVNKKQSMIINENAKSISTQGFEVRGLCNKFLESKQQGKKC